MSIIFARSDVGFGFADRFARAEVGACNACCAFEALRRSLQIWNRKLWVSWQWRYSSQSRKLPMTDWFDLKLFWRPLFHQSSSRLFVVLFDNKAEDRCVAQRICGLSWQKQTQTNHPFHRSVCEWESLFAKQAGAWLKRRLSKLSPCKFTNKELPLLPNYFQWVIRLNTSVALPF